MFITLFKKESVLAFGVSSREETIQRNLVLVLVLEDLHRHPTEKASINYSESQFEANANQFNSFYVI